MQDGRLKTPQKQCICGTYISQTNYQEVVEVCSRWIDEKRRGTVTPEARYVCVTSVHGIVTGRQNKELKNIINGADIATPDGMPVVWAMRSFGVRNQQRVYGPTLMLKLCQRAATNRYRVFLYGSSPEVLSRLADNLSLKYPELIIAGSYSPPFRALTPHEQESIRRLIREADPDLVFVGISTPKQETWMAAQRDALPGIVMIGVGAAFDFHAGKVKQAPSWMQDHGLEWLYRLLAEPGRLWRRYLLVTPKFLPYWAMQLSGLVKYDDHALPPE